MRRTAIRPVAALIAVLAAFALLAPATAQEASNFEVTTADPSSITFSMQVSGEPISEAVLHYQRFNPDGNIGGSVRADVPSRGTGFVEAEVETNRGDTYIPVGTRFTYYWTLETEDGTTVQTETEAFVFLDGRFAWQLLEEGGVRVYWYDDPDLAQSVLEASATAVADLSELLDVDIDFPITVVLYGGGNDGQAAERQRGGVYDEMSRTGGTRVAPDLVHVYDSLGLTWEDITRHEITHVITSAAGDGAFTSIPAWLDEGLATYAQADKGTRVAAVEFAVETDNTLRLRNLGGPTNRPELIDLFYGQSWAVVEYMIDTYGEEAMAELLATIKAGNTTDQALQEVYSLDQDSLYNEWRVSRGLDPIEYEPVAEAPGFAQPDATRAPLTLPTSVAGSSGASSDGSGSSSGTTSGGSGGTPDEGGSGDAVVDADGEGGDSNVMVAAVIGAVTLLLAAGLGFFGFRMLRS